MLENENIKKKTLGFSCDFNHFLGGGIIICQIENYIRPRSALRERARRLWSEMTSLREKLNAETTLWRREKEEFQLLRERSDFLAFEEATAAARAAAAAYAIESPLSGDLGNPISNRPDTSSSN